MAGGHTIDSSGYNLTKITVQGTSIRIMLILVEKENIQVVAGDVENEFINAYTKEMVYTRLGTEFEEL